MFRSLNLLKRFCTPYDKQFTVQMSLLAENSDILLKSKHEFLNFDKTKFEKSISVPCIVVKNAQKISNVLHLFKPVLLKYRKFHSILEENGETFILLDQTLLDVESLSTTDLVEKCKKNNVDVTSSTKNVALNYDNFSVENVFKEILPKDETLSSYTQVGHIVHLNLKEHLSQYKYELAQVLLDKVPGCKTVVNKSDNIETQFRNLTFELLAGDDNYVTRVREHGLTFELDFSKVFWNSRLSMERERMIRTLQKYDCLYDVFAGVGPFSLAAAVKRQCRVIANDLNPDCVSYLEKNVRLNKAKNVEIQNLDGGEFIRDFASKHLARSIKNEMIFKGINRVHFLMNLPAIAVDFLHNFPGLLNEKRTDDVTVKPETVPEIFVHCYTFCKGVDDDVIEAGCKVDRALGGRKVDDLRVHFVRNVAPYKNMMRASFKLTSEMLFED